MSEVFLVAIVAVMLAGLTTWQAYKKWQSDEIADAERCNANQERLKAEQARREANASQASSIGYLTQLNDQNLEIQSLQELNVTKSERIIEEQNETFKHVTGFGVPQINVAGSRTDEYVIHFVNSTNYPVYDLQVEQVNLTELIKHEKIDSHNVRYVDNEILISNLQSNIIQNAIASKNIMRLSLSLPKCNNVVFVLYKIVARHGTFMQYCAIQNMPAENLIQCRWITYKYVGREQVEVLNNISSDEDKKYFEDNCPFYKRDVVTSITI